MRTVNRTSAAVKSNAKSKSGRLLEACWGRAKSTNEPYFSAKLIGSMSGCKLSTLEAWFEKLAGLGDDKAIVDALFADLELIQFAAANEYAAYCKTDGVPAKEEPAMTAAQQRLAAAKAKANG